MSASEIQLVSESIAFHPPIVIFTLCIFMYIRGRMLAKDAGQKVLPQIDNK